MDKNGRVKIEAEALGRLLEGAMLRNLQEEGVTEHQKNVTHALIESRKVMCAMQSVITWEVRRKQRDADPRESGDVLEVVRDLKAALENVAKRYGIPLDYSFRGTQVECRDMRGKGKKRED